MPKPMLKHFENKSINDNVLSATYIKPKNTTSKMNVMELERLLRKKRSKEYLESITNLDAGGHVHNQTQVNELIDSIKKEFNELNIDGFMLGIVAPCYLGDPYEVHTLDIANSIVKHYQISEPLPKELEKARSIALRGNYEFIEVYTNYCCAVSFNGSVSIIHN